MPAKRTTKRAAPSRSKRGVPSFLSLRNRKFVVLLVLILGFASYGSYKLYSTSAYTPKRAYPTVKECYAFKPYLYEWVGGQSACVKTVQAFYNRIRIYHYELQPIWPSLATDGVFGPRTKLVTAVFQKQVTTTGIILHDSGAVDGPTWEKMYQYCRFKRDAGVLEWCGWW